MGKHLAIVETGPTGTVTDAPQPLAVTASFQWRVGTGVQPPRWIDGWALAWTATEVLVWWREHSSEKGSLAWLHASAVRRRKVI